jgi:N utilization substance protein B
VNDSQPFSKRTLARKAACDILYQMDLTGDDLDKVLAGYRRMLEEGVDEWGADSRDIPSFSRELVDLYLVNQKDINGLIASYADRWSLERMPIVDRNLLRLGFTELLFRGDIPTNVTINEYLELAKAFSTSDSGKFINGVMGKLVKDKGLDSQNNPHA